MSLAIVIVYPKRLSQSCQLRSIRQSLIKMALKDEKEKVIKIKKKKSFKKYWCCLVFCTEADSLCLVYSWRESCLLNTNKARAHLHGRAPDSFQTRNSYSSDRTWDLLHRSSSLTHWATAAQKKYKPSLIKKLEKK